MRPGAAGPVTRDAPGCCDMTTLPLTKKLPSSSSVSGPPRVPADAPQERDAARSAKYAFMAVGLLYVDPDRRRSTIGKVTSKEKHHVRKHHPSSPRAPRDPRTRLPRLPRPRRHGEVASAERLYRQGPRDRRPGRRYAQDVVHELQHRGEPLLRRPLPRAQAERTASLHRPV